jgi:hypothetical protein
VPSPSLRHWSAAVDPSAQIVAARGSFLAHTYIATVEVGGAVVGSAVGTAVGGFVGSDVGTAVGGFVGPVVGTAVGGFVGSDVVGAGGGGGGETRQPLVVSNTADTGLEKWLPPSCSMTQKNAGKSRSRKRRCHELVSRYCSKEIIKEIRKNLPPPLQANSPLLYVLISSIT